MAGSAVNAGHTVWRMLSSDSQISGLNSPASYIAIQMYWNIPTFLHMIVSATKVDQLDTYKIDVYV